jgi:hypothetical protein
MLLGNTERVNFQTAIDSSYMGNFSLTTNIPDKCFSLLE